MFWFNIIQCVPESEISFTLIPSENKCFFEFDYVLLLCY